MSGVSSRCKICSSGYRKEIERMLITEGKTYVQVCEIMKTKGIDLNPANLSTHKNRHMPQSVDSLRELTGSQVHLITPFDVSDLSPEQLLEYVAQEAVGGIEALKLLPVSHYTLNARNNFLSTIRQIAETQIRANGGGDKEDITELINQQLKARGLMVDVTPTKDEEEDEATSKRQKLPQD